MVKAKRALALPTAALVPLLAIVLLAGGNALKAAAAGDTEWKVDVPPDPGPLDTRPGIDDHDHAGR